METLAATAVVMDKADMVRNNVKCVRNDVTRRKTLMDFFAASSSRKKTDATSSAPFALSFFFLSVWVLPFFCFVFFVLFLALFFNLLFWKKKKTCAIESKKKERFFDF